MRYFKIMAQDGSVAAFGKNDIIGEEITEEEYNALLEQYPRPDHTEMETTAYDKARAWDILTGVAE